MSSQQNHNTNPLSMIVLLDNKKTLITLGPVHRGNRRKQVLHNIGQHKLSFLFNIQYEYRVEYYTVSIAYM